MFLFDFQIKRNKIGILKRLFHQNLSGKKIKKVSRRNEKRATYRSFCPQGHSFTDPSQPLKISNP
jgi:hypothetical protein